MGCVPHRANGVRPERPAWVGVKMVSEVVVVVGGCGIVCRDSYQSVLEMVMPARKKGATSATKRHAGRVGQRSRTAGRGSGRTTKTSRSRKSESIAVPGTNDRVKVSMNNRNGGGHGRVIRGKKR